MHDKIVPDNHEMTELELYRKEIVNKDQTISLLKKDMGEMQEQIQNGYIRIKELIEENEVLKELCRSKNDS
tara:strand:- start:127 stop:339 length:213 start_codon:yes stop_codon:yes gene_type:complete